VIIDHSGFKLSIYNIHISKAC